MSLRSLIGKVISAANMKKVQAAHDSAHDLHTHTVALGAECNGMKLLAGKECAACDGTGQVKKDGKQEDCAACDGTGVLKAAGAAEVTVETFRAASCGCGNHQEGGMTKADRIAALLKNEHNPVKELKTLEVASEDFLTILENQAKANGETAEKHKAELKAAQEKADKLEADLKAAQAAQIPAEEVVKLRALAAERDAQDAKDKAALVAKLEPLKALTKEQLEAKSLDELKTLAAFAKVDVDYSIKGIATPRAAAGAEDYTPPNPYGPVMKSAEKVN